MFWFLLIALVVVVAAVTLAVVGGDDDGTALPDAEPDRLADPLPLSRPVSRADVDTVRFPVVVRGYRMTDVDDVLDRLAAELAERDARIAELETALAGARAAAFGAPDLFREGTGEEPANGRAADCGAASGNGASTGDTTPGGEHDGEADGEAGGDGGGDGGGAPGSGTVTGDGTAPDTTAPDAAAPGTRPAGGGGRTA